jgi:Domain of unknown function (DUF4399)
MTMTTLRFLAALLMLSVVPAFADDVGVARAYIISPADGATVSSPFVVQFGLDGAGVAPAGVEKANTGHHHLLIDTDLPDLTSPIPADDRHRHFGGGQTQVELTLPPGQHTLQLLLGDYTHTPHNPPIMSDKITITVE